MIWVLLTWLFWPVWSWRRWRLSPTPRKILLIQTAKIGDMLCATPAITALAKTFPSAQLDVLLAPVTRSLIEGLPGVNRCLTVESRSWKGLTGKVALARRLRQERYDLVVILSPALPLWLAALWSGIPKIAAIMPSGAGHTYRALAPLLSFVRKHPRGELILDSCRVLLACLGVPLTYEKSMVVDVTGERVCVGLGLDEAKPMIGIAVSSANKLKELGAAKLAALVSAFSQRFPSHRIVLLGSADDRPLAELVMAGLQGDVINSCGQFTLTQLPVLLKRLQLFVGVDSGLTYMADTFQVPLISIVGPVDAVEQRPLGSKVVLLQPDVACYPCVTVFDTPYQCHGLQGDRVCLATLDVGRVVEIARELLPK